MGHTSRCLKCHPYKIIFVCYISAYSLNECLYSRMKNASFPLQHISLDLSPNEWIRSDQFSISCSVSVELVLQTQPTLFPQSPRADHKPLDCSRETNRNGSETQTSERDHAHRIKNNTDNRHLEGSRCDL